MMVCVKKKKKKNWIDDGWQEELPWKEIKLIVVGTLYREDRRE